MAANKRDHAERTSVVATILHLEIGASAFVGSIENRRRDEIGMGEDVGDEDLSVVVGRRLRTSRQSSDGSRRLKTSRRSSVISRRLRTGWGFWIGEARKGDESVGMRCLGKAGFSLRSK